MPTEPKELDAIAELRPPTSSESDPVPADISEALDNVDPEPEPPVHTTAEEGS
jgi:hypothetical protein